MDYTNVHNQVTKLQQVAETCRTAMNDVSKADSTVASEWSGEAAEAFHASVALWVKNQSSFIADLEAMAQKLQAVVDSFEETEKKLVTTTQTSVLQ